MRILSENFKAGLANNWRAVYCIKISADSGDIYWLTNNKNNLEREIILCDNLGSEIFIDGTCESLTVPEWYSHLAAVLSITTLNPYAGLKCMRIDFAEGFSIAYNSNVLDSGKEYLIEFYAKSLSGNTGLIFGIGNTPNSEYEKEFIVTGNYQKFSFHSKNKEGKLWLTSINEDAKSILFDNLTLKEIEGVKEYDSSILAKKINGETMSPISSAEQNLDIFEGGNVSSYSGINISCLNQTEIYKTLNSKNITNCNAELLFGFIPNGEVPVLIESDLTTKWIGKVGRINYDSELLTLEFKDNIEDRHLYIPTVLITKENYSRAPDTVLGKPLPLLFGDFATEPANLTSLMFARYNICPTVCIDFVKNIFCVAGHPVHSKASYYNSFFYNQGSVPSIVMSINLDEEPVAPELLIDNSGLATLQIMPGNIVGLAYCPLKYVSNYNTADVPENAIDLNANTFTSILSSSGKRIEVNINDNPSGEIPTFMIDYSVHFYMMLDSPLSNSLTFQAGYRDQDRILKNKFFLPTGETLIEDVIIPSPVWVPPENWFAGKNNYSALSGVSFSIRGISGATPAETIKIKCIGIYYIYTIVFGLVKEIITPTPRQRGGYQRGPYE